MKELPKKIIRSLGEIAIFNFSRVLTFIILRRKNLWVFGSWHGETFSDNTKYFYLYVKENCPEIEAVWITKREEVAREVEALGGKVCFFGTLKSIKILLRAGVVLTSCGFVDLDRPFFGGTLVVRLWHGMPPKKINYDRPFFKKHPLVLKLTKIRDRLMGSKGNMLISTSERTRETLLSAFPVEDVSITGQPRNDILFKEINKERVVRKLLKKQIEVSKIISYLPTFREKSKKDYLIFSREDWNSQEMEELLEKNKAILLIKGHFHTKERFAQSEESRIVFLKEKLDAQVLLAVSDILITDYSSCYIDYLLTERPIIFTPFDIEEHKKERGFYYDYNAVTPGPKIKNFLELKKWVREYLKNPEKDKEKRIEINNLFNKYKDDKSSERVLKEIKKRI